MKVKLSGWDLLTWRLAFEDKGIVPLVGAQVTLRSHLDHGALLELVCEAVAELEVLRLGLSAEKFPSILHLEEFDVAQCVQILHNHVDPAQLALRTATSEFSMARYRSDLPLWRLYVVYKENETLLFAFLHHAIADGRGALEIISRLCGQTPIKKTQSQANVNHNFGDVLENVITNPVSLLQQVTPALLGLNSLAALSPQHTLPEFSGRAYRDDVIQFSLPKEVLRSKAKALSVSVHDVSVALGVHIIKELEGILDVTTPEIIRLNIPVSFDHMDTFNKVLIARIVIPREGFEATATTYRKAFQTWREKSSIGIYPMAIQAISKVEQIDLTSFATISDVTISSLPHIPNSLAIAGNEVTAIWPLVPSMGSAFNITSLGLKERHFFTLTFDVGTKLKVVDIRRAIRASTEKCLGLVPDFEQQL